MTDIINQYLAEKRESAAYPVAPAIRTKKGGVLSVQASHAHYCSPQNDTGPYTMVEVLVISPRFKVPKSFGKPRQKFDDGSRLFPWVPVEAVVEAVNKRGGIA